MYDEAKANTQNMYSKRQNCMVKVVGSLEGRH